MAYPWDIIKKAHSTGLLNLHIPEAVRTVFWSSCPSLIMPLTVRRSWASRSFLRTYYRGAGIRLHWSANGYVATSSRGSDRL